MVCNGAEFILSKVAGFGIGPTSYQIIEKLRTCFTTLTVACTQRCFYTFPRDNDQIVAPRDDRLTMTDCQSTSCLYAPFRVGAHVTVLHFRWSSYFAFSHHFCLSTVWDGVRFCFTGLLLFDVTFIEFCSSNLKLPRFIPSEKLVHPCFMRLYGLSVNTHAHSLIFLFQSSASSSFPYMVFFARVRSFFCMY